MYKKIVKFEDVDGNEKSEELLFNLTKAEIIKLQVSVEGGFDKYMQSILNTKDTNKILNLFDTMIKLSYGKRTEDGMFIKDENISKSFIASEAYSALFMELLTNEAEQQAFFLGIMPKELAAAAQKELNGDKAIGVTE